MFQKQKELICTQCGNIGKSKKVAKGSTGVELVLWLCFIIPGLIYSIWRVSSYHNACRVCKNTNLIPLDSPMGKKKLKEIESMEL